MDIKTTQRFDTIQRFDMLRLLSLGLLAGCAYEGDPPLVGSSVEALAAPAPQCTPEFIRDEVLKPASDSNRPVYVNCSMTLQPTNTVTRRLYLVGSAASGVTIDCNGAKIDHGPGNPNYKGDSIRIESVRSGDYRNYVFDRPTDITIRDCEIHGAIRILGMAHNGQGNDDTGPVIRYFSSRRDFTTTARNAAPTRITLDKLKIIAAHRTPLYLAPGVTHTKLLNSELSGWAVAAAIYLDAESAFNTFRDNKIHTVRERSKWYKGRRELISIDGSAYNKFINNRFSALSHGGIYVYRNCGEGGTSRHAWPQRNQIINNVFYYKSYSGLTPAVFLGSKDGFGVDFVNPHCREDNHNYFGSGIDDADFARYNVVMQNQIYKRPLSFPYQTLPVSIRQQGDKNKPNYVAHNDVVTADIDRRAGCYVSNGYPQNFILHGETMDVFRNYRGEPTCYGYQVKCNDGDLEYTSATCKLSTVSRACSRTGSNDGCRFTALCPLGKRVIGARAACNLEWGSVSADQLNATPANHVNVVRRSDDTSGSMCSLNGTSTQTGTKEIQGLPAGQGVEARCKEHDRNGGDCYMRVQLYCHGNVPYREPYNPGSGAGMLSSAGQNRSAAALVR